TVPQAAKKAVSNTNVLKPGMYRIDNRKAHTRAPQLPQTVKNNYPRVSTSTKVAHKTTVSRPQLKSNQSRDKVLPNNSQVKDKKTQVKVYPMIPSVSNKMKSVTVCKDNLNSRTLNANVVTLTQAWLWHRRLSRLNFDYINLLYKKDIVIGLPKLKYVKYQLCSSCELSKAKKSSFKSKVVPSSKGRLNLLHMDLCGPMRVASINRKKYILVIVDDYSRYTWTLFLRSKDETLEMLKDFLTMIQRNLQAPVNTVRTNKGIEFLNKTLNAFFKEEGIEHQTSTARTPEQNGVVERRNHAAVPSQQELDLLFGPLYDEFFNAEEGEQLQDDEFTDPFCTLTQDVAESSTHNIDHPKKVYRLRKALYGLKQAPRAWTEYQLAGMFTKALPEDRFKYLVRRIGDSLNLPDHSFQDDAKYERGGQDTRLQGGKRRSRQKDKDLNISNEKTKLKDNHKSGYLQSLQTVHMLCRPNPYYNELNKVAIGYKNPLCLTRAKQVQPALYNGHEIIKDNHAPAIVHNTEDTLEIAEITRKKMNDKMKDPECVTRKVKIAPHDYSKENFLATFTP
nr:retrovirus-related Pol polyprotein from transposon TNT 1-94 [Tanacetum cinerariifolium]